MVSDPGTLFMKSKARGIGGERSPKSSKEISVSTSTKRTPSPVQSIKMRETHKTHQLQRVSAESELDRLH